MGKGRAPHGTPQPGWGPTVAGWRHHAGLSDRQLQGVLRIGPGGTRITAGWPRSLRKAASDHHGNAPCLVLEIRVLEIGEVFSALSCASATALSSQEDQGVSECPLHARSMGPAGVCQPSNAPRGCFGINHQQEEQPEVGDWGRGRRRKHRKQQQRVAERAESAGVSAQGWGPGSHLRAGRAGSIPGAEPASCPASWSQHPTPHPGPGIFPASRSPPPPRIPSIFPSSIPQYPSPRFPSSIPVPSQYPTSPPRRGPTLLTDSSPSQQAGVAAGGAGRPAVTREAGAARAEPAG